MKQLAGFGLSGFRSFRGGSVQALAPLGRVNLLAGQNNTGKSNVLRFAQAILSSCHEWKEKSENWGDREGEGVPISSISPLDLPYGESSDHPLELAIALPDDSDEDSIFGRRSYGGDNYWAPLQKIFSSRHFRLAQDNLTWIRYTLANERRAGNALQLSEAQMSDAANSLDDETRKWVIGFAENLRGIKRRDWEPGAASLELIVRDLNPLRNVPPVATIEAFRQVRESDGIFGHDGAGLIGELAKLERPGIENSADKERFEAINRFLRTVLSDPTVQIEIPHHRKTIHVHRNDLTLPLENLGAGIHQVVILAATATLLTEHLICMEEPEIHLHPLLQRKLLHYLATETANQYLIATHSAHILDSEIASIFHVSLSDAGTEVRRTTGPKDLAAICTDLGYRPSDLVQANAVIWVEGPSDRIYLRHWISLFDPSIIEGIHYSIMFYGGRLLNHLSARDPDVDDFISLRRLNRHIAILIDSDKEKVGRSINETKQRVVDEFNESPGFAWVTHGYTIENYVPPSLLAAAISDAHPDAGTRWSGDLYSNPLGKQLIFGVTSGVDKVAIARACTQRWEASVTPWPHDLETQVSRIVTFIHEANGLNSGHERTQK